MLGGLFALAGELVAAVGSCCFERAAGDAAVGS